MSANACASAGADAALVAALFAVDPVGTGGVCLRSPVHPARDQWLQMLRNLLPATAPLRRVPCNITDGRLLGGLDLVATLKANRPIAERGALAATDGGVIVVSMAERLTAHTAACLNAVIDSGEVALPREGVVIRNPARLGVVALDEGISDEEFVPRSLLDRLAFLVDFNDLTPRTRLTVPCDETQILAARALLPRVRVDSGVLRALCATSLALRAGSPRVSLLAARVAAAAAALEGRMDVNEEDATLAGRLVLAPRATAVPAPHSPPHAEPHAESHDESRNESPAPRQEQSGADASHEGAAERSAETLEGQVLAAAQAAIPAGLLARLRAGHASRLARSAGVGRAGAQRSAALRGRPCGVYSGAPRHNGRLNVIETLRAAAPWQGLRGRSRREDSRVLISAEDFRVTRYRLRAQTLTIFVVDASGSSALHRLAEAKGAVELLLAECYIRRDQVAVIGFRGRAAALLLPPTRALVRAKRSLAELAGGGGTPLAAAIETAAKLSLQAQRRGETPTIVMLTDGRANVARNGVGGRDAAQADALCAAGAVSAANIAALFIDTAPRPNAGARDLAGRMNAQYIPLPFADARVLSDIVRTNAAAANRSRAPR